MNSAKEINFHYSYRCSIKGFDYNFQDRISFMEIIRNTLKVTDAIVLNAWRPNSIYVKALENIAKVESGLEHLVIGDKKITIKFSYKKQNKNYHFLDAITDTWFGYDTIGFCFLAGDTDLDARIEWVLNELEGPSFPILSRVEPYFFFYRGIEDDVLWIEKSDDLSFDDILENWGGERRYL